MPRIDPDVARIGAALADPSRVAMLDALMDGKAHAIGALARHAGITAATASGHPRERVQHLAGRLGAALAELCLAALRGAAAAWRTRCRVTSASGPCPARRASRTGCS